MILPLVAVVMAVSLSAFTSAGTNKLQTLHYRDANNQWQTIQAEPCPGDETACKLEITPGDLRPVYYTASTSSPVRAFLNP